MSRHITVQGKYRNGRIASVGMHNPQKGDFTQEQKQHLMTMLDTYIKPNKEKFKSVKFIFTYNGIDFSTVSLEQDVLYADTQVLATRLINIYNHRLEMLREV